MSDSSSFPASNPQSSSAVGSVERGIAGNYQFEIKEVLSEAWSKTNGSKLTFLVAYVIYVAILAVVGFVVSLVTVSFDKVGFDFFDFLRNWIPVIVGMPMAAGLVMLGLRRSAGVQTSPMIVLSYYHLWIPILILTLFLDILVVVGLVLLVIPGIYLVVAYTMATPLLVDKGLAPWEAMETSRKALTHQWFKVFGLILILGLLNMATILTLGIGLFWTVPLTFISIGILYQRVFGIEAATLNP